MVHVASKHGDSFKLIGKHLYKTKHCLAIWVLGWWPLIVKYLCPNTKWQRLRPLQLYTGQARYKWKHKNYQRIVWICRDNRLDGSDGILKLNIQISWTPRKKFKSEKSALFGSNFNAPEVFFRILQTKFKMNMTPTQKPNYSCLIPHKHWAKWNGHFNL